MWWADLSLQKHIITGLKIFFVNWLIKCLDKRQWLNEKGVFKSSKRGIIPIKRWEEGN